MLNVSRCEDGTRKFGSWGTDLSSQIKLLDGIRGQGEELLANSFSLCDDSMPGWIFQNSTIVVLIQRCVGNERFM